MLFCRKFRQGGHQRFIPQQGHEQVHPGPVFLKRFDTGTLFIDLLCPVVQGVWHIRLCALHDMLQQQGLEVKGGIEAILQHIGHAPAHQPLEYDIQVAVQQVSLRAKLQAYLFCQAEDGEQRDLCHLLALPAIESLCVLKNVHSIPAFPLPAHGFLTVENPLLCKL